MSRKGLKNLYLIFSIIVSVFFFVLEQNHDCSGDGCLICLFSLIINVFTNALLLITFVPTIVKKVSAFLKLTYSNISSKEFGNQEKKVFIHSNSITNTDLVSFGVKIQ